jgi:hypothetical protein
MIANLEIARAGVSAQSYRDDLPNGILCRDGIHCSPCLFSSAPARRSMQRYLIRQFRGSGHRNCARGAHDR